MRSCSCTDIDPGRLLFCLQFPCVVLVMFSKRAHVVFTTKQGKRLFATDSNNARDKMESLIRFIL